MRISKERSVALNSTYSKLNVSVSLEFVHPTSRQDIIHLLSSQLQIVNTLVRISWAEAGSFRWLQPTQWIAKFLATIFNPPCKPTVGVVSWPHRRAANWWRRWIHLRSRFCAGWSPFWFCEELCKPDRLYRTAPWTPMWSLCVVGPRQGHACWPRWKVMTRMLLARKLRLMNPHNKSGIPTKLTPSVQKSPTGTGNDGVKRPQPWQEHISWWKAEDTARFGLSAWSLWQPQGRLLPP